MSRTDRLPSSYNEDDIKDEEIDDIEAEILRPTLEVRLEPREHGDRWMLVGVSSQRTPLIEVGYEDQGGEDAMIFHAREATKKFVKRYEERYGRLI